jgi:hypothetical protein
VISLQKGDEENGYGVRYENLSQNHLQAQIHSEERLFLVFSIPAQKNTIPNCNKCITMNQI